MLSLKEIQKFYSGSMHYAGEFLLREYLQYKLLEIIYRSEFANSLVLMGGTCLRLIHGNNRFSEDLGFDNTGLGKNDFTEVSDIIRNGLELEGYETEIKVVLKSAFHCYVRFPEVLFREGLSGQKEQKILIQLDTESQNYSYTPEKFLVNKFDVFTEILTTPLPTLLAQKFYAVLNRKRNKGRDFFDIIFIMSMQVEPDWQYMEQDIAPFLFQAKDAKKVTLFSQLIDQPY